jgi:imidazolonepropionase-like amidohydrolase
MKIPTLARSEDADAFVAARLAEGSDFIKAVFDDGAAYGLRWPTLDRATLEAVVRATGTRGRLAVVHIGSAAGAQGAIEAGAHGLVHLFADAEPSPDFAQLVKSRGAFVIPTLTVIESLAATRGGAELASDPKLAEWLRPVEIQSLKTGFPLGARRPRLDPAIPRRVVRVLFSAGVPILAGTDAPNPGTVHGASLHRELELLVASGLTPLQALAAATSVPARVFGLADRGRIAAGMRADLLLVDGDPTTDVKATRAIAGVWKGGVELRRARPETVAVPRVEDGKVSDFEKDVVAEFGSGWHVSTDEMLGGKSEARMERSEAGALRIAGTLRGGSPYPVGRRDVLPRAAADAAGGPVGLPRAEIPGAR